MVGRSTLDPEPYDSVTDVSTPAVLVDLDTMEQNLEAYASFAEEHDVSLRSHVKTHKIPALAHRQHRRTSGGIVCQTLTEAEVMAEGGIEDIYLYYNVVGERKLDRLINLSESVTSFATTVDCRGNIDPLRAAAARHDTVVDVILELDVGLNRVGVNPDDDRAQELAAYIESSSELHLAGIMAYEAHVALSAETEAEFSEQCWEVMERVQSFVEQVEADGIEIKEVKVGGTATSKFSGQHPVVTEINPGMYPFNDVGELNRRHFELSRDDCAVTVLTSVISRPTRDRAIVDAGSKSISFDIHDLKPLHPTRDDITYDRWSEEHGWLNLEGDAKSLEVGDKLQFIVPHVCTTINLHDTLVGVRDGDVESVWNVQARGMVK